jgi:pimeloyl-ACP methyl ester carboxylesterase
MRFLFTMCALMLASGAAHAQQAISFPTSDGGLIHADVYGAGARAIVLAHGGRLDKGSWREQAGVLVAAGYRVLAFDFRGIGQSRGPGQSDPDTAPLRLDVLAAIDYLRRSGATSVDVIGASMGGSAAADAVIASPPGLVRRLVLGAAPDGPAGQLKCPTLFIVARDDANDDGPRLPGIRAKFAQAPQPKRLVIVDGSAHAQFLFRTDQGARVLKEIMDFLQAG